MDRDLKSNTIALIKLEADEGFTLTDGENYSKCVYIGKNDSPDNWHEIPDEEVPTDSNNEEVS